MVPSRNLSVEERRITVNLPKDAHILYYVYPFVIRPVVGDSLIRHGLNSILNYRRT